MSDDNLIYVLNKRLALYQAPHGFRTSMDSVMLAAACPAKRGDSILDLGCGVGSAGLCVLKRVEDTSLTGLDIQEDHIEIAKKNAELNNFTNRIVFMQGDIREKLKIGSFNHVICNPPYKDAGSYVHATSTSKAKAMGHYEEDQNLQDWITCAWHHIKGQGSLTMIHEANQLDHILHSLYSPRGGRRFGAVQVIPLYPKAGVSAKRVIIRAFKHKKAPCEITQGLIMHEEGGAYTTRANAILRNVAPLYS